MIAEFTAPAPNRTSGDFTAAILWGDGTPPTFGTVSDRGGVFVVSGSHRFRQRADFPVVVLIADAQGEHGFALGSATVQQRGTQSGRGVEVSQRTHARLEGHSASVRAKHAMHDRALGALGDLGP